MCYLFQNLFLILMRLNWVFIFCVKVFGYCLEYVDYIRLSVLRVSCERSCA